MNGNIHLKFLGVKIDSDQVRLFEWYVWLKIDSIGFKCDLKKFRVILLNYYLLWSKASIFVLSIYRTRRNMRIISPTLQKYARNAKYFLRIILSRNNFRFQSIYLINRIERAARKWATPRGKRHRKYRSCPIRTYRLGSSDRFIKPNQRTILPINLPRASTSLYISVPAHAVVSPRWFSAGSEVIIYELRRDTRRLWGSWKWNADDDFSAGCFFF